MSSGFIITVGCEEFFEDARKNFALYFNPEHMKTVLDLKHRVQRLIKQDFFLLWKPCTEDSYYYLLDDEQLHFVQSRDKFRLSKVNEAASSTELVNSNGQACLFNNIIETREANLEKEKIKPIEQVEFKEDKVENVIDVTEELLMEYEDVVDNSTRKKRKRTRKHKSKKQKLETNENSKEEIVKIEPTITRTDHLNSSQETRPVELSGNNSRSHIRFQTEDAIAIHSNGIDISQTNENVKQREEMDVNIDYELYEVDVKKKKKSKKKQVELCEAKCESTLENVASCLTSTPIHDKIKKVTSFSNNSHMIKSAASNTKPNPRRRSHTNSLANFITQLSSNLNSFRTENSEVSDKHDAELSKHGNEVSSEILDTNPDTSGISCNEYDLTNSHRRLSKKNKSTSEMNGTYNRVVLENIQQFKQHNIPNMPLVFERKKKIKGPVQIQNEPVQFENTLEKTEDFPGNTPILNGIDEKPLMSNGIEDRIAQIQSMSEDQVACLTPLKEPKENDVVLFKVLKMDASYNPTLSSYVCGKVKSVCKVTSQLSLDILNGHEELAVPQGKFSLDQEESECAVTEYSINWNELYDARQGSVV
uniref:Coilin n=1 Tax=Cacopsylla melanoneura TaxID=428564 RepID=A0A8D8XL17_9HEMI